MKIKTAVLKQALANLSHLVARRVSLPILSCARIHAQNNTLFIEASNLDEYQTETVECEGALMPICIGLRRLEYALGGEEMEITLDGKLLRACFDGNTQKLTTLPAEEFPPAPKGEFKQLGVSCVDLADGVDSVAWAASTDVIRYKICSVCLRGKATQLSCVSTDGRLLAAWSAPLIGVDFEAIVPAEFVGAFSRLLRRDESALFLDENIISVTHKTGSYFCKLLDVNYPDWNQAIPSKTEPVGKVISAPLLDVLNRCIFYSDGNSRLIKLTFEKSELLVSFLKEGDDLQFHIAGEFEPFMVAVSCKLLKNCVLALGDKFDLSRVDELSPLVLVSGKLKVILMPMRLT